MKHITERNQKTLVDRWIQRARLQDSTEQIYRIALDKYCELHDMTPEELKKEAEDDLRAGRLPSELRILDRYYDFLEHLEDQNMSPGTINVYKSGVKSFYRSFIIEIPKINSRGEKVTHLEKNLWHGFTKEEVNRMLRATIRIRRKKVGQDFVTFCSPEATKTIQQYLEQRADDNPYLFVSRKNQLTEDSWSQIFIRLADKLGDKYKSEPYQFNKVRSHNFRKFFNSQLLNNGCQKWLVEYMMGHILTSTDRAHFEQNSNKLKELYAVHLHTLTIEGEIHKLLSPEANEDLKILQNENKHLKEQHSAVRAFFHIHQFL